MHLYSYLGLDVCAVSFMYGLIVCTIEMIFFALTSLLTLFGNEIFMMNCRDFHYFFITSFSQTLNK